MPGAAFDRRLIRRGRWVGRLAHGVDAACRAAWADILAGFATYGAASAGCHHDLEPSPWTEADLDALLSMPAPPPPAPPPGRA